MVKLTDIEFLLLLKDCAISCYRIQLHSPSDVLTPSNIPSTSDHPLIFEFFYSFSLSSLPPISDNIQLLPVLDSTLKCLHHDVIPDSHPTASLAGTLVPISRSTSTSTHSPEP